MRIGTDSWISEGAQADVDEPTKMQELVADKGYHSNETMVDLDAVGLRSYVSESDRGRRDWSEHRDAQRPVYANRRRIRAERGKALLRRRGEYVERAFAHVYDTGGMRRTHLRGRNNILKRVLVHVGGFNLGLLMRSLIGFGKARRLQGLASAVLAASFALLLGLLEALIVYVSGPRLAVALSPCRRPLISQARRSGGKRSFTTGC